MRKTILITTVLALVAMGCREQPATQYYYPADLENRSLPAWSPTNQLPVSPSEAVATAMEYVLQDFGNDSWKVDNIELSPIAWTDPVTWEYTIRLSCEFTRSLKIVRVLLDGDVWEPEFKERK